MKAGLFISFAVLLFQFRFFFCLQAAITPVCVTSLHTPAYPTFTVTVIKQLIKYAINSNRSFNEQRMFAQAGIKSATVCHPVRTSDTTRKYHTHPSPAMDLT